MTEAIAAYLYRRCDITKPVLLGRTEDGYGLCQNLTGRDVLWFAAQNQALILSTLPSLKEMRAIEPRIYVIPARHAAWADQEGEFMGMGEPGKCHHEDPTKSAECKKLYAQIMGSMLLSQALN